MVRRLINFAMIFFIFWTFSTFFTDMLVIKDINTLFLATTLMFVMGFIFTGLFILSFALIPLGIGCLTTPVMLILAIFFRPFELWILNHYLPGFSIGGFWSYVVISILIHLFTLKKPKETK